MTFVAEKRLYVSSDGFSEQHGRSRSSSLGFPWGTGWQRWGSGPGGASKVKYWTLLDGSGVQFMLAWPSRGAQTKILDRCLRSPIDGLSIDEWKFYRASISTLIS